eukprot:gene5452-6797_t
MTQQPILTARGLVKRYGRVTALDHADFDLYAGEVLAVIGDNGAGKSSLIKAISGAVHPDEGEITLDGKPIHFRSPMEARDAGIETVYQNLALSPALSIADNMFLGREIRKPGILGSWLRMLDRKTMEKQARDKLTELGLMTIQNISQAVETLSGGQRQGVAVARAAAFGSKVVIMDEPTAALGVKESRRVLELIQDVKKRGLPIVLISHNMPHVFEVADRIHIHRLGKRLCVIDPKEYSMSDAVAFMTGAKEPPAKVNAIIRESDKFIRSFGYVMPPFAYWSPEELKARTSSDSRAILDARLGWDITDYGQGKFDELGLFLFTTRNGNQADLKKGGGMLYAEKIMISREKQLSPMHRHIVKAEDIINRGGGTLVLELFNSNADGSVDEKTDVEVATDGRIVTLKAGGLLKLQPGESVTLLPGNWHAFWGEGGDVLIGEVSTVNDDLTDNIFREPIGRFSSIEEDEAPVHLLVSDYDKWLA